jgi:hypothetical protein
MKIYFVKWKFPFTGVIRLPSGAQEALGGSMVVEAEDEEFAKDEVMFRLYGNPLSPTRPGGGIIKPVITSVEEVVD